MSLLEHNELLALHEAIVATRLSERRGALLGGISRSLVAALPVASSGGDQVLCDLHALNDIHELDDGSCPLLTWLSTASMLVSHLKEKSVFETASKRVESRGSRATEPRESSLIVGDHPPENRNRAATLLSRVLPTKVDLRRRAVDAISQKILQKIQEDTNLDEADIVFAESVLGDITAKYMRLKRLAQRVAELDSDPSSSHVDTESTSNPKASSAATSEDWVAKFREDASLVDDEVVREIYARILRQESDHPNTFSLRTLGVLRYLDHTAAVSFGALQCLNIDNIWVPQRTVDDSDPYDACRLTHANLIELDDAGLLNAGSSTAYQRTATVHRFHLPFHRKCISLESLDGAQVQITLPAHMLTPAGKQLARLADRTPNERAFRNLLQWFRRHAGRMKVFSAEAPVNFSRVNYEELQWNAHADS